jgi:hypothetical protein
MKLKSTPAIGVSASTIASEAGTIGGSPMTSPLSDILQQTARDWLENDGRPKHLLLDLEEAEQAITALLDAAIGPIEHIKACPANGFTCICPMWQQNKNDCKAEIRQKLGIGEQQ